MGWRLQSLSPWASPQGCLRAFQHRSWLPQSEWSRREKGKSPNVFNSLASEATPLPLHPVGLTDQSQCSVGEDSHKDMNTRGQGYLGEICIMGGSPLPGLKICPHVFAAFAKVKYFYITFLDDVPLTTVYTFGPTKHESFSYMTLFDSFKNCFRTW